MKKKVSIALLLFLIISGGVVYYVFNKPHRNVSSEKSAVRLTSQELFNKYSEDEKLSDSLYLNKNVEVTGRISEILKDQKGERVLVLKEDEDIFGVVCSIDEMEEENKSKAEALKSGDIVTLKGICTGFISDVKLNKCVILDEANEKPI